MSNRNLGILAVVAAVMVVWAVLQSRFSHPSRIVSSVPVDLIQGLDTSVIDSIVIGHGDDAVSLAKRNDRFVVVNKENYPADPKLINGLIAKCLDVKRTRLYTSSARNHEDLEVTDDTAQGLVRFFRGDGTLLTGIVVGKSPDTGVGAFVRLADSNDVYVSESVPYFATSPLDYINTELVSVPVDDVNLVTVSTPDGAYTLRPSENGLGAVMVDMPADKILKTDDARSVLEALSTLRFADVNTPEALGDLDFDHAYVCLLNNSIQYTLSLAEKDGKHYVRAGATFTDMTPVTITQGVKESDEQLKPKEAKLRDHANAQTFDLRHRGWIYEISSSDAEELTKSQADLLEDRVAAIPDELLNNLVVLPGQTDRPEEPNQSVDPNS